MNIYNFESLIKLFPLFSSLSLYIILKFDSPWRKPIADFQRKLAIHGFGNIRRTEIHSVDKTWTLVDDDRVRHIFIC